MNIKKVGVLAIARICTALSVTQAQVLKSNRDSVSHALGKDVGSSLASNGIAINTESFLRGVNDAIQGKDELIGEEEGIRIIKGAFAKAAEERINVLKKEETTFFDTLQKKAGVQHL